MIATIPPYQATVVLLSDVFDYKSREIADILETTEGAIKAALHRGRKRLATTSNHLDNMELKESTDKDQALIEKFLAAFRFQDPMEIANAYRRLVNNGIRADRHLKFGKTHFTFCDPAGNRFSIVVD